LDEAKEQSMTTFNMAVATLMRLDNALKDCNQFSRTHQFKDWFYSIEVLYKELKPYFKSDEAEKIDKYYNISKNLASSKSKVDNNSIHNQLLKFEISLREIINKRGLDFPRSGDPRFALGGGM